MARLQYGAICNVRGRSPLRTTPTEPSSHRRPYRRHEEDETPSDRDGKAFLGSVDSNDVLKPGTAFQIYDKSLEPVRISVAGDKNFFAAQKAWMRLTQDFPVQEKHHRCLLACAFSGTALSIFEDIASSNLGLGAEELWRLAGERLCNASHQR